jgi:hypothetical protein
LQVRIDRAPSLNRAELRRTDRVGCDIRDQSGDILTMDIGVQ